MKLGFSCLSYYFAGAFQLPYPTMWDSKGNILTTDKAIEERAIEVYEGRIEGNTIKPHLSEAEILTNELCEARLEETKKNKTQPWTIGDLKNTLKDLGNNKSRDALDHANELFKEEVAGDDMMLAVLKLINMIKQRLQYPELLEKCNITSLYKKKDHTRILIIIVVFSESLVSETS